MSIYLRASVIWLLIALTAVSVKAQAPVGGSRVASVPVGAEVVSFGSIVGDDSWPADYARDMRLWYRQPASEWVEALPVGNGRIGAMLLQSEGDVLDSD